jgi:hypothetical protein
MRELKTYVGKHENAIDQKGSLTMNSYRPEDYAPNTQKVLSMWVIAAFTFIVVLTTA